MHRHQAEREADRLIALGHHCQLLRLNMGEPDEGYLVWMTCECETTEQQATWCQMPPVST